MTDLCTHLAVYGMRGWVGLPDSQATLLQSFGASFGCSLKNEIAFQMLFSLFFFSLHLTELPKLLIEGL